MSTAKNKTSAAYMVFVSVIFYLASDNSKICLVNRFYTTAYALPLVHRVVPKGGRIL